MARHWVVSRAMVTMPLPMVVMLMAWLLLRGVRWGRGQSPAPRWARSVDERDVAAAGLRHRAQPARGPRWGGRVHDGGDAAGDRLAGQAAQVVPDVGEGEGPGGRGGHKAPGPPRHPGRERVGGWAPHPPPPPRGEAEDGR